MLAGASSPLNLHPHHGTVGVRCTSRNAFFFRTECHDIARNDTTYLMRGGLHCSRRQNLHTMLRVISDAPQVSLPNAGLMEPELGDEYMTFVTT